MKKVMLVALIAVVAFMAISAGWEWVYCRSVVPAYNFGRYGSQALTVDNATWQEVYARCGTSANAVSDYMNLGFVGNPQDWLVEKIVDGYNTVVTFVKGL